MKKGISQMWFIIATAIIAILVVVFMLIFFRGGVDQGSDIVKCQLDSLGDNDNDKITNLFDKCPCDPNIGDAWPEGQEKKCKIECDEGDCEK